MRYYKDKKGEFIENGSSKVRVGLVTQKPSKTAERTIKILEVLEVVRRNGNNQIEVGHTLSLSFPNRKLNADDYTWGIFEERQVPMVLNTPPKVSTISTN